MRTRPVSLLGVLVSLAMGGCLPRGEPPAGRQILADPTASLLQLVPPNGDGTLRVLFFRPSQDQQPDALDLWELAVDASGASTETSLVSGIGSGLQLSFRPDAGSPGYPFDARGRAYVVANASNQLLRVDPVTAEQQVVGLGGFPTLSPSGQRVVTPGFGTARMLYEADDGATTFAALSVAFVGEVLYYVSPDCNLMRIAPGGAPEQVASVVDSFVPAWGSLLLIEHATVTADGATTPSPYCELTTPGLVTHTSALLDMTTLAETPLPADLQYGPPHFSADGQWLSATRYHADTRQTEFVILQPATGTIESLGTSGGGTWRPGHDELWIAIYDASQPGLAGATLLIDVPGQSTTAFPGLYPLGFTHDGTYWYSTSTPLGQTTGADLIGPADDPTAPRHRVVPVSSSLAENLALPDGRLLVGATTGGDDFRDIDYLLVDPRDGASQVVGLHGFLAATGDTRMLGIFEYAFERGDLTSVDYATGQSMTLASEFAMAAIPETQGDDGYPPNARVVYQYRARYDSPWSGLWLVTVP